MIRSRLFAFLLLGMSTWAFAQDEAAADSLEGWTIGGNFNINFSLVQLDNWAGGGENSMSLGTKFLFNADYKKGRSTWNTTVDAAYGQAKIGDDELQKTDDQLMIISKYGYDLHKHWFLTAAIDYRTQMTNGFNFEENGDTITKVLVSKFMSPGFLIASLGAEYRPNDNFFASISPVSSKTTFVIADDIDETQYGLDPGAKTRTEFGLTFKSGYKKENIVSNVNFSTLLTMFGNYERLEHLDVNWEAALDFKINKYLYANYSILLIYDDDINVERNDGTNGPAVQLKQVLNIGLTVKF